MLTEPDAVIGPVKEAAASALPWAKLTTALALTFVPVTSSWIDIEAGLAKSGT
jgi:hypothetical protein